MLQVQTAGPIGMERWGSVAGSAISPGDNDRPPQPFPEWHRGDWRCCQGSLNLGHPGAACVETLSIGPQPGTRHAMATGF